MEEFRHKMQLTLEDYIEYNLAFQEQFKIKLKIKSWQGGCIGALLLGIMSFFIKVAQAQVGFIIFMFITGFIFGFLFTLLIKLMHFLTKKCSFKYSFIKGVSKRKYKKTPDLQKEYLIVINKEGIESQTDDAKTFIVWKRIIKVIETENAFYFFIAKTIAHAVLKRNLESMEELVFMQNMIEQNIAPEKIKYLPLN